jgi:hypothetical protein
MFLKVWEKFSDLFTNYEDVTAEVLKKALGKLGLPEDKMDNLIKSIDKNPPVKAEPVNNDQVQDDVPEQPQKKPGRVRKTAAA